MMGSVSQTMELGSDLRRRREGEMFILGVGSGGRVAGGDRDEA